MKSASTSPPRAPSRFMVYNRLVLEGILDSVRLREGAVLEAGPVGCGVLGSADRVSGNLQLFAHRRAAGGLRAVASASRTSWWITSSLMPSRSTCNTATRCLVFPLDAQDSFPRSRTRFRLAPLPDSQAQIMPSTAEPYLSVVVTARNDDHGGNLLSRMQAFVMAGWARPGATRFPLS